MADGIDARRTERSIHNDNQPRNWLTDSVGTVTRTIGLSTPTRPAVNTSEHNMNWPMNNRPVSRGKP
jgi:hypothetical protein